MEKALETTLGELQQQLNELETLDSLERERLENAIREIQDSLDRFDIRSTDLAKRFHQTTQGFSDEYPRLTQTAGRFADMLSHRGI